MIFRSKNLNDPMTIVRKMCNWIIDQSILQEKKPGGKMLILGAKKIERVASEVYKVSQGWRPGIRRLGAADD